MADELISTERVIPARLKRTIMIAGATLAVLGFPAAVNLFCVVPIIILSGGADSPEYVLISFVLATITFGAGGVSSWHAYQSLKGKPSRPLRLPSMLILMGSFGGILFLGLSVTYLDALLGLFIPPLLLLAAALPPVAAISWFTPQRSGTAINKKEGDASLKLSWRRVAVAFAGGASVGLVIAIALEILLPAVVLALGFDLFGTTMDSLNSFFSVLERTRWTAAWMAVLINPGFIYVLLHFTLIAPLVEEFSKPLVTLPILRHLNRQQTFLVGAIAGAGFAVLENTIYATIGINIWVEFLFVRALGCAIQPLGSGFVALGWQDILRGVPRAWASWSQHFGIAVVVHTAWNFASLLVVLLWKALLTGILLRRVGLFEIAALGMLFIFLCLLGLSTLWFGRAIGKNKVSSFSGGTIDGQFASSDAPMAIWTLASLALFVPAGIILLRLWLQ